MPLQSEQTIQCLACQTPIPFDAGELVRGRQFVCPGCGAAIALASESREVVSKALTAFDLERARLGAKVK